MFPFIAADLPQPFRVLSAAARPVLGNGVIFSAVLVAIGAAAVRRSRSSSLAATTVIAGACACLLLLGFESTAILSGFYLSHQSALLLFVLMAELAAVQVGGDLVAAGSRRITGRTR
ncbi:MAG: hypothetical protein FJ148_12940 [Deltaproteobacteria bacterium]|nr:hypothetical protein [Deltaproteobacteria bacterium]